MNVQTTVDRLGKIKAKMADLKNEEDELKNQLLAEGISKAEGQLFRVSISRSSCTKTCWKAVAEKLEPSRQLIQAHTTTTPRIQFRVVARIGELVSA